MWDNYQLLRGLANLLQAAAVLILLFAAGLWFTHRPTFAVKKIQIHGEMKRVMPEQLKFVAEHQLSGTFFTLDLDKVRALFSRLPWVRDVQVRRRWPDALDIEVEEHVALARWGDRGMVNIMGEYFDVASDQALPILYGPAGTEKEMSVMLGQLQKALAPVGIAPQVLGLSTRRAWKVLLDNQVQLQLGRNDTEQRISRFAAYWRQEWAAAPYYIEYVDLRYPNGFTVRARCQAADARCWSQMSKVSGVGATGE